jgi:predicted TIM-barrel fold metal-dependent hydrolase
MPAYMIDCAARAEFAIAEFEAAGVHAGVVVQEYLDGEQNDYLLEVVRRWPDRFFVHGLPDYWNPDHAADEARNLIERGFRGLKLPAEHLLGKIALDDRRLMRVWEMLEEHAAVLAVDLAEGQDQVPEFSRVLERCPRLSVVLGHLGMPNRGGWPGQLMLCHHENVCLDTGGIIWLYRHEGYPFPGAVKAIRQAINEIGVEKVMWGSDWPRTMIDFTYRQSIDFLRDCPDISAEEKSQLLGGNAARLYQLPDPPVAREPMPLITEQ